MCSKLTIKKAERHQWRRSGVFIVNFEHITHLVHCVSIVNFEQVNADWVEVTAATFNYLETGTSQVCNCREGVFLSFWSKIPPNLVH